MKNNALKAAFALTAMLGSTIPLAPNAFAATLTEHVPTSETISPHEDPAVSAAQENLDCEAGEEDIVVDANGAKHVIKCITLSPETIDAPESIQDASADKWSHGHSPSGHWSPYEDGYFRCGSSYVRNQQIAWYRYRGTVHASGEYGSGGHCDGAGRVVAAAVTYKRDGRVLASARAGIGQTKHTGTWDHPGPNHAKTQVYYDFTLN